MAGKGKKNKKAAFAEAYQVEPGRKSVSWKKHDPDSLCGLKEKKEGKKLLAEEQERLDELQEVLYAQASFGVLIIIQAMDTGGKDSTIRHVVGPLNPQGVRVTNFKKPSDEELAHDYLWRVHRAVPRHGMIGVFNRSHYEEVLIARVHGLAPKKRIEQRYEQINAFEKYLSENNILLLKFFLYISKDEQKDRLQRRLDRPDKHWKFDPADIAERALWDDYVKAYERALTRCSTPWAPWHIIPSNHKWARDVVVARILREAMEGLPLKYPPAPPGLDEIVIDGD
jgi:PPK2 family polyphosphate:nucleotide phosphotransferase